MAADYQEFGYTDEKPWHTAAYLMPQLEKLVPHPDRPQRILDVGCGNGYIAGHYLARGNKVVGIDGRFGHLRTGRRIQPDQEHQQPGRSQQQKRALIPLSELHRGLRTARIRKSSLLIAFTIGTWNPDSLK